MKVYDLHSHSIASDGTLSPKELVLRAVAQGVDVLALTDHDTVEGIQEAQAASSHTALTVIPGVEISSTWGSHTIHVVGLNVDIGNPTLLTGLASLQQIRVQRAEKIATKLEKAGIPNALEGARELAGQGNVTRTHFARHIVNIGKADNVANVFKSYLSRNKPGYVKTQWADLEQAIQWIHQAGGQAVIAHPDRYRMTATKFRTLLTDFKNYGGNGIEVIYSGTNRDVIANNAKFARSFDLQASVGSDFHSPGLSWVELGQLPQLPKDLSPIWSDWAC